MAKKTYKEKKSSVEQMTKLADALHEKVKNFDLTPSAAKIFATDIIFNSIIPGKLQNKMTFNENFFHSSDLTYMKEKIMDRYSKDKKTTGTVYYGDTDFYPEGTTPVERKGGSITDIFIDPAKRLQKTLGEFPYTIDLKTNLIQIGDQFNFNDANPKFDVEKTLSEKIDTVQAYIEEEATMPNRKTGKIEPLSTYGIVRKVGQHLGSPDKQGAKFNIKIPIGEIEND